MLKRLLLLLLLLSSLLSSMSEVATHGPFEASKREKWRRKTSLQKENEEEWFVLEG
jgi:Ni/Co efflux regulator RcnB